MSQDEYIRTALRVPPGLHKAIHESADNFGRSFNAEIVARLQESFAPKGDALGVIVAGLLGGVLESIPEGQRSERVKAGIFFAKGVLHRDGRMLADSMAHLTIDPSRPVSEQDGAAQGAALFLADVDAIEGKAPTSGGAK